MTRHLAAITSIWVGVALKRTVKVGREGGEKQGERNKGLSELSPNLI